MNDCELHDTDHARGAERAAGTATRRSLIVLAVVHAILGILAAVWCALDDRFPYLLLFMPIIPLHALVMSQSCLLAFWAVMPSTHPSDGSQPTERRLLQRGLVRAAVLVVGTLYLEVQFVVALNMPHRLFLVAIATAAVTIVLSLLRTRGTRLVRHDEPLAPNDTEQIRFSIRELLILTFAIAALLAILQRRVDLADYGPELALSAIWACCFVITDLVAIWAVLEKKYRSLAIVVVLEISVGTGVLFSLAIRANLEVAAHLVAITVSHAMVLLGSLMIVRRAGYRLTRPASPS